MYFLLLRGCGSCVVGVLNHPIIVVELLGSKSLQSIARWRKLIPNGDYNTLIDSSNKNRATLRITMPSACLSKSLKKLHRPMVMLVKLFSLVLGVHNSRSGPSVLEQVDPLGHPVLGCVDWVDQAYNRWTPGSIC